MRMYEDKFREEGIHHRVHEGQCILSASQPNPVLPGQAADADGIKVQVESCPCRLPGMGYDGTPPFRLPSGDGRKVGFGLPPSYIIRNWGRKRV